MARRAALVENVTDKVINVILIPDADEDLDWPIPEGCRLVIDPAPVVAPEGTLTAAGVFTPAPVVLPPDPSGFLKAVFASFNKVAARTVMRAYPDFGWSLLDHDWVQLRAVIEDARADGAITAAQRTTLLALLATHRIP